MPRAQKKYHYIYKTTCIVTQRYYIGMHSTNNLEDGYIGSGKRLWNSVGKHGLENHVTEILEYFSTRTLLKEREKELVSCELLKDPLCMNLITGGEGGWDRIDINGESIQIKGSRKGSEKISYLWKNSVEWAARVRKNRSIGHKKSFEKGRINRPPDWTGKSHSEETKEKMRGKTHQVGEGNSQFGKVWIHHQELKQSKSVKREELETYLATGWTKGRYKHR